MAITKTDSIGVGLKFPIEIDKGSPSLTSGTDLIDQSIGMILSTSDPTFFEAGLKSKLELLIFEQNDKVVSTLLRLFINEALAKWERRIKIQNINIEQDGDYLLCYITYNIVGTADTNTMVYPFYRNLR